METWEYKVQPVADNNTEARVLTATLNTESSEGWELVTALSTEIIPKGLGWLFIYKRSKT